MFCIAAPWPLQLKALLRSNQCRGLAGVRRGPRFPSRRSDRAKRRGRDRKQPAAHGKLFNLNVPTAATESPKDVQVVPMGLAQYGRTYEKRQDPGGRNYYWALWSESDQPLPEAADVTELRRGNVTLTPLKFDLTEQELLESMSNWNLKG